MSAAAQPVLPAAASGPPAMHDFYVYPFEVSLAGGQQGVAAQVTIDEDSDFIWHALSHQMLGVAGAIPYSVYIENASRQTPFMPVAITSINLVGPVASANTLPRQWAWLRRPYRIAAQSVLNAVFNNLGAGAFTVELDLIGYKVPPQ